MVMMDNPMPVLLLLAFLALFLLEARDGDSAGN
jgi:hypothetical protein